MPARYPESDPARNVALDYLRAAALCLMALIHMWRGVLGRSGVDAALRFVGEAAPFLFFVAFGMTQSRLVTRRARDLVPFVVLFGFIGLFHGYFMFYSPLWEFFLFLWFASLLAIASTWLGLRGWAYAWLGAAVLALNLVRPLGVSMISAPAADVEFAHHLWLFPGTFYPLPWAAVVFFGLALGLHCQASRRGLALATTGVVLACGCGLAAARWPGQTLGARLTVEKWSATSPYMLLGCSATFLLYAALGRIARSRVARQQLYPTVRFLSDNLLLGTILHYLVTRCFEAAPFHRWSAFAGVRTASGTAVVLLSILDLALLVAAIAGVRAAWQAFERGVSRVLRKVTVPLVSMAAVLVWVALQTSVGVVRPGYVKWGAYAAMLGLALFYDYDRRRRFSLRYAGEAQ